MWSPHTNLIHGMQDTHALKYNARCEALYHIVFKHGIFNYNYRKVHCMAHRGLNFQYNIQLKEVRISPIISLALK
jgi:hypothetical protein